MNRFLLLSTKNGWEVTPISVNDTGGTVVLSLPKDTTPHFLSLSGKSAQTGWSQKTLEPEIRIPQGAKIRMPKLKLVIQNKSGRIFLEKFIPVRMSSTIGAVVESLVKKLDKPKKHFRQIGRVC